MFATLSCSETAAPARMDLTAFVLRLSLAVIFVYHALDKIVYNDCGAAWVNEMYLEMPAVPSSKPEAKRTPPQETPTSLGFMGTQLLVAWGELLGGLALGAALLTRSAALGLMVIQAGAVILVTAPQGLRLGGGGYEYEYNLALLVMCLDLLILGAGKWSVDWVLIQRRTKRASLTNTPMPIEGFPAEPIIPGATG